MAATTQLEVANMALGVLTESPIGSMDEDSTAARMLQLHFETTREAELTKRAWVFATLRAQVDATDTTMADWPYAYELPADCLRAFPVDEYGCEVDWRQEGSQLLTRDGGTRTVRYIANIIDPNDWPSVFTEVLAAALAIKIAHPITAKAGMVDVARQAYKDAVATAVRLNAVQKSGRAASHSWESARAGRMGSGIARARHGAGW